MDFYAALGVSQSASTADINSAYKKLALKLHPDKTGGDDDSMAQFRKIQEAVETLRDPVRRRKHDESLGMTTTTKKKRYRFPEDDWRTWWDDDPSYKGRRWNFDDPWDRYMYSFGTSVHMNPNSEYAKEERARHAEEARRWEEEYAGYDPEVEKARNKRRREAMRARVMRDEQFMEEDDDENDEAKFKAGECEDYTSDDEPILGFNDEDECGSVDQTTEFESVDICFHDDNECNCGQESLIPPELGDSSFDPNESYLPDNTDLETDEEEAIFYDCSSEMVDSVAGDDETDRAAESQLHLEDLIAESAEEDGPVAPFIPYFTAKVNRSNGRYTADGPYAELSGLVRETFCGWLEDLRVSFPDAEPLSIRNNPWDCPHLGSWERAFGCAECEVCHFWKPIYVLTCSGCGAKACVRCKFMDDLPHQRAYHR